MMLCARNWNTPMIFDLKDGTVTLIVQAERHFGIVDNGGLHLYTYEGKLWKVKPLAHKMEVIEVHLDHCGPPAERRLAIIDKNRDLYLSTVRNFGNQQNLAWNDQTNMLAALQDGKLTVWYYPNAVYVDKELLSSTVSSKDTSGFGNSPQIVNFIGNHVTIRRADGALVSTGVSPYPVLLYELVNSSRWDDAVRLCRFVKDEAVWGCLAAMASYAKELNTAEIAYAAVDMVDKVQYILYIKEIPLKECRAAEMALFCGNAQDAEGMLLQASLIFRAIMMNISLYNWDRALELAVKHKTHVDTVLGYRQKFLNSFNKVETNKRFLQFAQGVEVNWEQIQAKIESEYQKEKERPNAKSYGK
ncbi:putative intraflagellar transport protein [Apostichopus japonicus]|uniref:Putative intraflagellar transport protein n=1 Tax=Stichopus japonicus TaxID=307972 RepID=A0A2G8JQ60_STIJA|nr:putative intraflagellar transport protein [Apostichopus japonicus]